MVNTSVSSIFCIVGTTSGTVSFSDGSAAFDSSDAQGYSRFTQTNGSAQIGLFRSGGAAGGVHIGGDSGGFNMYASTDAAGTFGANILEVDMSGNLQIDGYITASGASGSSFYAASFTRSGATTDTVPDIWGDSNNFVLGYILMIISIFSVLEFARMLRILLKKNRALQFLSNLIFIFYIFYLSMIILTFSFSLSTKMLFFLILLICIASDIGGFVFGKIFKGPKLTKISPNKTISGVAGSLIFSLGLAIILIYLFNKNFDPNVAIIGLITSFGCQTGDLFFSLLKSI